VVGSRSNGCEPSTVTSVFLRQLITVISLLCSNILPGHFVWFQR
jgi:hypothetical protein